MQERILNMDTFLHFLALIGVGAFIGGLTNEIAIRMLFWPYKPIYIGKFRLPFTPGVIPKRQEEIAGELGKLVMKHLITADEIEKRLSDQELVKKTTTAIQRAVEDFLDTGATIGEILNVISGSQRTAEKTGKAAEKWLTGRIQSFILEIKDRPLAETLPENVTKQMEQKLPALADLIINEVVKYFESEPGFAKIKEQVDQFIKGKGKLGELFSVIIGNQSLVKRIYPEIIKFAQSPSFYQTVLKILQTKCQEFKNNSVEDCLDWLNLTEDKLAPALAALIRKRLPIEDVMACPVNKIPRRYKQMILAGSVPKMVSKGLAFIAGKAKNILAALEIEEMVADQVRRFSVKELEQVVLMISRKELRMITYLGFLLGGIIGFIQGLLFYI